MNQGRILVCLHGFPTSSFDFEGLLPALHSNFQRIILIDFIGFGFSDKPSSSTYEYSVLEQANMVETILSRNLNLKQQPLHVLAHDYGVTIAQELLDRTTSKSPKSLEIASICWLNGGLFADLHKPILLQNILVTPYLGAVVSQLSTFRLYARNLASIFGNSTQPTEKFLLDAWNIYKFNDGHKISHKLLQYIPERKVHRDRWVKAMQTTYIPVGFINGPADPVSGRHMLEAFKATMPNNTFAVALYDHIAHYPQIEAPDEVLSQYQKFLTTKVFGK